MKVTVRSSDNRLEITTEIPPRLVEDEDGRAVSDPGGSIHLKTLFARIGPIQQILEDVRVCGHCESTNTRLAHRPIDTKAGKHFDFFEGICGDCEHALGFWISDDGMTVEAKRKDQDKAYLPDNGWMPPWKPEPTWSQARQEAVPAPRYDDIDEKDIPFMWIALLLPALSLLP